MVRADELRGMTDEELTDREADLREQLFKLRFQKTTGQVENAGRLRSVRRDLARVLTVRRERELGPRAATEQDASGGQA